MNLRQILLVAKREYLTKVRTKAFILATVLIPLGMIAFIGVGVAFAVWESDSEHRIGIVDETGRIFPRLQSVNEQRYVDVSAASPDSLRQMVVGEHIDGYVTLGEKNISSNANPEFVYGGSGGLGLQTSIRSDLREAIREERLQRAGVSEEVKNIYDSQIGLDTRKLTAEGEETEDDTGFLTIIGVVMGVIIFISLFGYGGLLTRSVIEEKTNRIIEVIASSVKPVELLLGKMAGVGALGITQLAIWILAFMGLSAAAAPVAGLLMQDQLADASRLSDQTDEAVSNFDPAVLEIPSIDPLLIVYFVIFFILGYLIYSSLFAAIGAAVDSETDTQQFMAPIMVPIMIAYFIMLRAMESPDESIAVIGSLIPFFSPIVMITRIAISEVPFWQIGTSLVLMTATFAGTIWLSAKIYSVGILSYGKSAGFRELLKWIRER